MIYNGCIERGASHLSVRLSCKPFKVCFGCDEFEYTTMSQRNRLDVCIAEMVENGMRTVKRDESMLSKFSITFASRRYFATFVD